VQPDGKIVAAGFTFGSNNLRRINPDGTIDNSFAANELEEIYSIVMEPGGDVIAGGRFGVSNGFGGARPAGAIRVKPTGARDPAFITQSGAMDLEVEQFALQPDGKIIIYGGFSTVGNTAVQRFARLNTDGTLDRTFTPAVNDFTTMAVQPDGQIIVGGYRFDMRGTIPMRRLNVDGTIDPTFIAATTTETGALADVKTIFVEPDGKVIVGGGFFEINGVPKKSIARLNPDGSIDNTFNLAINYTSATIYKVLRRPSGKLYVAGRFVNGSGFAHALFRFTPDGTPEVQTLLNSQFPSSFLINDIAFQNDGKMLIAGPFNLVGNTAIKGVARVNEDGFADTTFSPPAVVTVFGSQGAVNTALPRRDGKVLIGGGFATIGGVAQSGLALLNSDGSLDPSFAFTLTSNGGGGEGSVTGFLRQPDGKILVKGAFNNFNSVTRCCASRLVDNENPASYDYDGDGRSDISVFRPATGAWYLQRSTAGFFGVNFGSVQDKIAPADYDGDGKTDVAVYRPSTGIWYVTNSSNGTVTYHVFGIAEDLPTPADYDGDGKADISVFRPSTGTWYRQNSSNGAFVAAQFGADGDKPTIGDFDGDGKADLTVFRPSTGAWYQTYSSNGFLFGEQFGISTDKITPADYDGDGKTDIAIYRPSEGLWYVKRSATNTYVPYVFGLATDIPVPGDFDGDGKADIGVFRPSDGTWYIANSANSSYTIYQFGQNGDRPTQSAFAGE
jgi:uncharacterized delta-60 repeat protein